MLYYICYKISIIYLLFVFLGMTELCGAVALQLPNHKVGSCGTVTKNTQFKIVDPESGKVLGPNQPGEICIKSLSIMTGYFRNPEATKNAVDEQGRDFLSIMIIV